MKILYVCHRFPFPPKRGGKIRPFNMIRHFARTHEVTVCSLARSEAEAKEGEGLAAYCKRYEMVRVHDPVQTARMVARLPTSGAVVGGLLLLARARTAHPRSSQHASVRPDLRPLLVGGAVRRRTCGTCRRSSTSATWIRRSGSSTRSYKPFPLSLGYALEGRKMEREEKRLARQLRSVHGDHARRMGNARVDAARAGPPTGFRTASTAISSPDGKAYDPDRIVFIGRMDYYPNQECMFEFCAEALPMMRARRPQATLVIVGADPSPAVRKLGELPGVTVTGSVPDVRPYLPVRRDGGAAQHRPRHAEQDSRSYGRWRAGGVQPPRRRRRRRRSRRTHLLVATTPAEYAEAILRRAGEPGGAGAAGAGRPGADALAPRLAAVDAPAGRHRRALPFAFAAGARAGGNS